MNRGIYELGKRNVDEIRDVNRSLTEKALAMRCASYLAQAKAQLLQAKAIHYCQIDACRLGGVNEVLAVILLAAKFGVPICPHAGGVGLCEYVQHLSMFDYIAVSASLENRMIEFVDHLHEHFLDPVRLRDGRYLPPGNPGYSIQLKPESLKAYIFPTGSAWQAVDSDA